MPDAVVLAGGEEHGPLREITGLAYRPLIEVGGRLLADRTLEAMRAAQQVERVALVCPEAVARAVAPGLFDATAPAGGGFADNILSGADALGAQGRVLVATADLPFLTPGALDDLAARALATDAALVYPVIRRQTCEARFPGASRTYVRLREGTFTGGNVVVADVDVLRRRRDLIRRIFGCRKNPMRLAGVLGLGFVLGLALGRLGLEQIERRGAEILQAPVAALETEYPEIGFDVDKPADLEDARRLAAKIEPAA
jgi:GTP:adenosylcobinamide-phosphate guanylyltransferase